MALIMPATDMTGTDFGTPSNGIEMTVLGTLLRLVPTRRKRYRRLRAGESGQRAACCARRGEEGARTPRRRARRKPEGRLHKTQ